MSEEKKKIVMTESTELFVRETIKDYDNLTEDALLEAIRQNKELNVTVKNGEIKVLRVLKG